MSDGIVQGFVYLVDDTKTYGSRGTFKKRLLVLEQERGKYGNLVPLEFIQDECKKADELGVGDEVKVKFECNGREWQKDSHSEPRYFVNLEVLEFKIVKKAPQDSDQSQGEQLPPTNPQPEAQTERDSVDDDDSIPF